MGEQGGQYGIVVETSPIDGLAIGPRHAGAASSADEAMTEAEAMLAKDPSVSGAIVFSIDSPGDSAQHLSRSDWKKSGHEGWVPLAR